MKILIVLLPLLFGACLGAKNLFTVLETESTEGIPDCNSDDIKSCLRIQVDFDAFDTGLRIDYLNVTFTKRVYEAVKSDSVSYSYEDDEFNEATFTIRDNGTSLFADINIVTEPHQAFEIHNCGPDCHVLIEEDLTKLPENGKPVELPGEESRMAMRPEVQALINRGLLDRQSTVTFTIKVYVTPQFLANTYNPRGYIENMIELMNTGFENTGIYMRGVLWCAEVSSVNDQYSFNNMLTQFDASKGSLANLRGGADVAMLLSNSAGNYCGLAWTNSFGSGRTTGVVAKSCVSTHTFAHEVGHTFGAQHNRQTGDTGSYPYGYGYLITRYGQASGYRTVMAYNYPGYGTAINYWSNDFNYNGGWKLGDTNNNNRRVLNMNRYAVANVGNEAYGQC